MNEFNSTHVYSARPCDILLKYGTTVIRSIFFNPFTTIRFPLALAPVFAAGEFLWRRRLIQEKRLKSIPNFERCLENQTLWFYFCLRQGKRFENKKQTKREMIY